MSTLDTSASSAPQEAQAPASTAPQEATTTQAPASTALQAPVPQQAPANTMQAPQAQQEQQAPQQQQQQASEPSSWDLKYVDNVAPEIKNYFAEYCAKQGISKEQAQSMIAFQENINKQFLDHSIQTGKEYLSNTWGYNYNKNAELAMRTVASIDNRTSGRLMQNLEKSGLTNNPAIVEAFYEVGKMLSEDSLGALNLAGTPTKAETPIEAFQGMFKSY